MEQASVPSASGSPESAPLPRLREDVQVLSGAPTVSGSPTWLIFDPMANRYNQIDGETYEILSLWGSSDTIDQLQSAVLKRYGRSLEIERVAEISRTLEQSELLVEAREGWQSYFRKANSHKPGPLMWLVHNYLFIRIPLVRPEKALKATLPLVSIFFSRTWLAIVLAVTLAGLYLVSRQWDAFVTTFLAFFTLDGLACYGLTLILVKAFHELGHAYTAVRFGCRVPTMGVAMLVMMPMLYTDVSDAWKLPSRRHRMLIDAGGIIVELMLAGLATFFWAFLPDGPLRSVAFMVATTSWMTSLAVNLSPLMRFDGYFLFSDWAGIPNLQSRANALGRWKLRELLFDLREPKPEILPPKTEAWVTIYAWIIWGYRLVVFTGIALVVYHMFFKVLGLILFAIEIGWFVLKPIYSELQQWYVRKGKIVMRKRSAMTAAAILVMVLLFVVPWSGRVTVAAVIEPAEFARLFPVSSGQVVSVNCHVGQSVTAGDVIAELRSPKLLHDLRQTETKIALQKARYDRRVSDKKDRAETLSIEKELAMLAEQREGLQKEITGLTVRAPFSGRIAELPPDLHVGRWMGRNDEIAVLVSPKGLIARGYLNQDDVGRVAPGTRGSFSFDDPLRGPTKVVVKDVAFSGAPAIEIAELASVYGGSIAVQKDKDRGLVPTQGAYPIALQPVETDAGIDHVMRGVVHLDGRRESLLAAFWRQALKVLVRESGA